MTRLRETDPEIFAAIEGEDRRQREKLILVASENRCSAAVREAAGSVMTDKYAEGYPGRRYYGGCEWVDRAEELARERARALFGCDHVNVQPHSGSQANMAVYFAILEPGDRILSMSLADGGHLSHGFALNFTGMLYEVHHYGVDPETERIDYDLVHERALEVRPKLIVCGASAYSRVIDFARFAEAAEACGAYLLADIAHIAGLVATGHHPSPVPYADFVTTTTHKTLRGPRGGMILCRKEHAKKIDKTVMPGIQGGPLCHLIAAKAVAFHEASRPEFAEYQGQIVRNARALADALAARGYRIVSGGTDNHLFLVDLRPKGVTGKQAEAALDRAGIVLNKNLIPYDPAPPLVASGIRIGTPAVTTRGMKEPEMERIAELIDRVLVRPEEEEVQAEVLAQVKELTARFPFPD